MGGQLQEENMEIGKQEVGQEARQEHEEEEHVDQQQVAAPALVSSAFHLIGWKFKLVIDTRVVIPGFSCANPRASWRIKFDSAIEITHFAWICIEFLPSDLSPPSLNLNSLELW